jgi:serine/threonine-protein kinase
VRAITPAPARILPRRLGRYQLFAHIGRGGMADIYLAQADTGFGDATRLVVIKEVLPQLAHSAEFAEMLVSEAKLAARLSHANVVKVEDLGRAGEILYIAMEYVEGIDLRELLRRCARNKVALPVEFSLRVVIEALRGLSFAHRAKDEEGKRLGIVHRDVSPSNVLLSFEGEVKLCDFGIARANPLAEDLPEEAILGKAGYMSPEQAWGEALDARADVFAAGIILWELLAGRRLYKAGEGERLLDLARAAETPPLPARDLPREAELHAIVTRALSLDRALRYPTAAAMLADLEDYAAAAAMVASPIRFGEWLMENFGQETVRDRRARERVMRALARGPAAVIRPIGGGVAPAPAPATAVPLPDSFLPDYDATPSAFPVALRDEPPVARATQPPPEDTPGTLLPAVAPSVTRSLGPRLASLALIAAGFLYVAFRILIAR